LIILTIIFIGIQTGNARTQAFPTAEGAGCFSIGGRGGVVYEVTNLNDSGPGSLRAAVEAYGPRTVVFRVSGNIELEKRLSISNSDITIAGQTAPGDGICIRDREVKIDANNVIIRYLRFRLGDVDSLGTDSIWGRYRKNIILDHCSASWSVDETMSFYGNDSMTVQWCLVSESLYMSTHPKGPHGYGGIWGGRNVSFHHNLLAHHSSRNPRFAGGETPACENVDFRNNVIFNWGFNSAYGGESGKINLVANYYKAGPATKSSVRYRIIQPSDSKGKWYIEDNCVDGYPSITENNWSGGVQGSYATESLIRAYTPFPYIPIAAQSAEDAYELVLENVGSTYPARDMVDARVIEDVRNGTATYDGYWYEIRQGFTDTSVVRGIIDSQRNVGGWPVLNSQAPPMDSDHDGMADDWELAHGLNTNDDSDRNIIDERGYTALENYLNSLVGEYASGIEMSPVVTTEFNVNQNYPNPFNPTTDLQFFTPVAGKVIINIYDLTGRRIKQLYNGYYTSGYHTICWNGEDDLGQDVASGIYFGEFNSGNTRKVVKMQLIR
jgi:hypothetical protein